MADEFEQYERKPKDDFEQYARKDEKPTEHGWFQPGSKSEAALRGASQSATFGFGDEAQALIRALSPVQINATETGSPTIGLNRDFGEYSKLRDEQRAANQQAAKENPLSYIAGSVAGGLPQAANIASVARTAAPIAGSQRLGQAVTGLATGGVYGGVQGAGEAKSLEDIPREARIQAALGGAGGALQGALVGKAAPKVVEEVSKPATLGKEIVDALLEKGKNTIIGSAARHLPTVLGGAGGGYAGYNKGTDPYSKLAEGAIGMGQGAAGGYALEKAPGVIRSNLGSSLITEPFRRLTDYVRNVKDSNNPELASIAQKAQALSQNASDDEKRKIAMELQSNEKGRAVTNSTSPFMSWR